MNRILYFSRIYFLGGVPGENLSVNVRGRANIGMTETCQKGKLQIDSFLFFSKVLEMIAT